MRVIIDPGHGGNDSGAVGPTGLKEKTVNLQIAVGVASILERHRIEAVLTRDRDVRVELADRVKAGANCYVSIHNNYSDNPNAGGTETYYQNGSLLSFNLAKLIQGSLTDEIKLANRGTKHKDLYLMRNVKMPAALVEVAFMSNPDEEKLLKSDEFIRSVGVGIGKGVLDYLGVDYVVETWQEKQGLEHLKNLTAKGIIDSPEYWKNKLLEPMPAWAIFALIDRGLEG